MILGPEHNDNLFHRQEQICHLSRIYWAQSTFDIKHKEHDDEVKAHYTECKERDSEHKTRDIKHKEHDIENQAHDIECKAHVIRHMHGSWKF